MRITLYNALFVSLTLHIVLPCLLLLWLMLGKAGGKAFWYVKSIISILYFALLFTAGAWQQVGYYFRYLLILIFVIVLIESYIHSRKFPFDNRMIYVDWIAAAFGLIISIVMVVNIYYVYQSSSLAGNSAEAARLDFPLKNGTYMICFGGDGEKSALMNYHLKFPLYSRSEPDQSVRYAVDIVELNAWGRSSKGFLSLDNESYEIYGETVYSPCDGRIVKTETGWKDETPFAYDYPYNPGNSIIIELENPSPGNGTTEDGLAEKGLSEQDSLYILLGHLKPGSILVQPGDLVKKGDPIAQAGNSGWTTEPHLHIQAMKAYDANGAEGIGVPILFEGRVPVKNSLFLR